MLGSCFFNLSKIYICYLKSFDKCIHWCGVCPHYHNIFITQESSLMPFHSGSNYPLALGDSCSNFYVHSLILPVLELHIIMASIAQIIFLNSSMLLTCTSSVYSWVILHCLSIVYLSFFCIVFFFQFGAIMNKDALNILVESLCRCLFSFSWVNTLE